MDKLIDFQKRMLQGEAEQLHREILYHTMMIEQKRKQLQEIQELLKE